MNALAMLVGVLTGIISGLGIGGGSLLVLYLTTVADLSQHQAGGINQLYYIGCAPIALVGHIHNKRVDITTAIWCTLGGIVTAIPVSLLTSHMDSTLLRRLFGILVIYIAIREWRHSNITH